MTLVEPVSTLSVVCHGHEHAERHQLTTAQAETLLEWMSGDNRAAGPRCVVDVLAFIREVGETSPPLARR